MKKDWEIVRFEDCIQNVVLTPKINSQHYLNEGIYPIVSQESSLISGFWNTEEDVFNHENPVIVFGDHTRVLKYIDFDFVIGADGVKILSPKKGVEAKYLYYYLLWKDIPSLGYSRHYKLLKDVKVPKPSVQIQIKIYSELDTLNAIITKKKQQLEELDKLAQATFYEMFGDPIINEKKWPVMRLGDVTWKIGSGSTPRGGDQSYQSEGISLIRSLNVYNTKFEEKNLAHINQIQADKLKNVIVEKNDILINITGASVARTCIVPDYVLPARVNQHVSIIRLNGSDVIPIYFISLLVTDSCQRCLLNLGRSNGATREAITKKQLEEFEFILPKMDLQKKFAAKIKTIESQKSLIQQSLTDTQQLFDYTMNKYFGS